MPTRLLRRCVNKFSQLSILHITMCLKTKKPNIWICKCHHSLVFYSFRHLWYIDSWSFWIESHVFKYFMESREEMIENQWVWIKYICAVANAVGEPLSKSTVTMMLTFSALEKTDVYSHSIRMWSDRPEDLLGQTWSTFCSHFVHEDNNERLRLLTASTTGYHGAHAALQNHDSTLTIVISAGAQAIPSVNNCNKKHVHTSVTCCAHHAPGNQTHATFDKRLGGSGRIFSGNTRPSCPTRMQTTATTPTPASNMWPQGEQEVILADNAINATSLSVMPACPIITLIADSADSK